MDKSFTIKKLLTVKDFEQAVNVQKQVWLFEDRDVLPTHFMIAYRDFGEQWGTFLNNKLIAIALLYPTNCCENYVLHMLGTLPEYQHLGIGENLLRFLISQLKGSNIRRLQWTYDPFDFVNSHLYLNKINAKGSKVLFNYYGMLHSEHHGKLPTHRLLCELDLIDNDNFYSEEKLLPIPMTEMAIRQLDLRESTSILDEWFKQLSDMILNGWTVTGFLLSEDKSTGDLILKK
jgi:predicted GNAT superfamily acetyltransferase